MKLLIIRHGDPDYSIDSLTEKGWKEADLLADRLCKADIKEYYVSPLGRAQDTAAATLKRLGRSAVELEWVQEFFRAKIVKPNRPDEKTIAWDWLPADWTKEEKYYDRHRWSEPEIIQNSDVAAEYKKVCDGLDTLLAEHGYVRDGEIYRVERANTYSIAIICHFGVECVMLSHLLGISPMVLWHGFCAAPTSVTTINTEERQEGIASFRVSSFGDISHLYVADEPPAFHARFCETYDSEDQRH